MRNANRCSPACGLAVLALLFCSPSLAEPPRSIQAMTVEVVRLHGAGDLDQAISLATSIVARVEDQHGDRHLRFAQALNNLAILYDDANRPMDAEKLYLRALSIVEAQPRRIAFQLVELKNNLGAVLLKQCRLNDAKMHFEAALELSVQSLGDYHPNSVMVRDNLRRVAIAEGRLQPSSRGRDNVSQSTQTAAATSGQDADQAAFMGLLSACMS